MLNITYTHSSSSSSSQSKTFTLIIPENGFTINQKITPQCKQIIDCIYYLSKEQETFTLSDIINYIDDLSTLSNTTFTTSKGGTDRIVRYYSKTLQTIGILTNINDITSPTE